MNADWKVEKAQYAEFNAPTCDKIAVSQLCKERQPLWNSHDLWWPELKMFGSMPWCSSPGYKLFRVNALLYSSLNLIDEFTSLFLRMHLLQVRLGKLSHRSMPLWTSVFFRHWASNSQDSPKGYFQLKELHRTTKACSQMNPDWKVDKAQYAEFNVLTWGKIAIWQLCSETQPLWKCHDSWWPELKIFGSMPWCSFPRQKLLPKLAQKNCHTTVWI